eukprot:3939410-Ditylum_brightwellii.AAC.1
MTSVENRMLKQLQRRKEEGTLRTLDIHNRAPTPSSSSSSEIDQINNNQHHPLVDFSSNDYLGLARSTSQILKVQDAYDSHITKTHTQNTSAILGATGSRLLSGNSTLSLTLESNLAHIHNRPCALLCNSGYDANLSILSSLPLSEDVVLMDALVHNSLIMGTRMSRIKQENVMYFRHNDVNHLTQLLERMQGRLGHVFVVVESVYSMDGDVAPLQDILNVAETFHARVIVDEAHGLGIYGKTNVGDLALPECKQTSIHKQEQQEENDKEKQTER